jgi:hypothetical protein
MGRVWRPTVSVDICQRETESEYKGKLHLGLQVEFTGCVAYEA